ncbi:hypothetical protein [Phytopseudomonas dryadis]|uniref:Uncharacterized protein n=1 Tax=Phytopseudomonas dryadis TaxID=2487520 RepID=A0A4Q9R4S0_9GAMM|nr:MULTISPECIES: hypothetical protein [Pseudomonas]TBU94407.1 hypothetical protein DNK44_08755 [Pseudomonas dryadis]TBU99561.1 hypothetical protein DNK34_24330 [Pseudomonas dryadis]TBV12658.1 hypothetical protein DNK41_24350 [Pseudomonas sp. FRB 230]
MSFNLANKSTEERNAGETEKARLFELWQQNLQRSKVEAARLFGEKSRRKGKWQEWLNEQLQQITPVEYASMVRSEVKRLAEGR